jgi:hypothetical protein
MCIEVLDDVIMNPPAKNATPPPKLNGCTSWNIWEQLLTYVSQYFSSVFAAPLTYLLSMDTVPTVETMAAEFDDIDKAAVETVSHTSPAIWADTTKLHDMLNPLIIKGTSGLMFYPLTKGATAVWQSRP